MIRMLIVGYCMGIRSERRLCEEVHLNLAYRWFCRLGLDGAVPDHSTFSKNDLLIGTAGSPLGASAACGLPTLLSAVWIALISAGRSPVGTELLLT
jgi:hypothetical protein